MVLSLLQLFLTLLGQQALGHPGLRVAGPFLLPEPQQVRNVATVSRDLPRPPELESRIRYWVKVYTELSAQQAWVHDAANPDVIYETVDLRTLRTQKGWGRGEALRQSRLKWRRVLLSLAARKSFDGLNDLEKRAHAVWRTQGEVSPEVFLRAAHRRRLRTQIGSKEAFESGLIHSKRYLPEMERIFTAYGLPLGLTRLPFVESSFNVNAISKVGASGIWQFMRSTGKVYLRIDDEVDERNDPLKATEAAARLLKKNYEVFEDWPLAVTAYNHGRKFVLRLMRAEGASDFRDIVLGTRFRQMGFASRNFYACLLAAIEAEKLSRSN